MKNLNFSSRQWRLVISCELVILSLIFRPITLHAQQVTIDFDDLKNEKLLVSQLYNKGVTFPGPGGVYIYKKSASQIGISGNTDGEFNEGGLRIEFVSEKSFVSITGSVHYAKQTTAILRAFDSKNHLVGQDGPKKITNTYGSVVFSIQRPNKVIKRIEFESPGTEFEIIDKLVFDGSNQPPPNIGSPSITISQVIIQPETYTEKNKLIVKGTVAGESLTPGVEILVDYNHPPFDRSGKLQLGGRVQPDHSFSSEYINPPIGPIRVSLTVQNIAGGKATEIRDLQNIPSQIVRQFNAEQRNNPREQYGNFLWGMRDGDKILALYEHLGIFATFRRKQGNQQLDYKAFLTKDPILKKWIDSKDQYNKPKLRFPIAAQTAKGSQAAAQDFEKGRIYSHTSLGVHYVPKVFADVLDSLGGESGCGFPTMDVEVPLASIQNSYTSLFQKFSREGNGIGADIMPTTFEIRGQKPKLYVERQGGDLSAYNDLRLRNKFIIPTIYEIFDCSGIYGPCKVKIEHQNKVANPQRFCKNGTSYDQKMKELAALYAASGAPGLGTVLTGATTVGIPTSAISGYLGVEWPPVLGNNVLTPLSGIVTESALAANDLPWSHAWYTDPCPVRPSIFGKRISASEIMKIIANWVSSGNLIMCRADWNIHVKPFRSYEKLLGNDQSTVEIEIENYYFRPFVLFTETDIFPGDLIYTAGRWIVDCGHDDYNTEIHPPSVVAFMRGEVYNNRQATVAYININNFYTGDPITINIYPPPRPSSKATLNWKFPSDENFCRLTHAIDASGGYLKLTFSSSHKHTSSVTDFGELKWSLGGGQFKGKYYVYWTE